MNKFMTSVAAAVLLTATAAHAQSLTGLFTGDFKVKGKVEPEVVGVLSAKIYYLVDGGNGDPTMHDLHDGMDIPLGSILRAGWSVRSRDGKKHPANVHVRMELGPKILEQSATAIENSGFNANQFWQPTTPGTLTMRVTIKGDQGMSLDKKATVRMVPAKVVIAQPTTGPNIPTGTLNTNATIHSGPLLGGGLATTSGFTPPGAPKPKMTTVPDLRGLNAKAANLKCATAHLGSLLVAVGKTTDQFLYKGTIYDQSPKAGTQAPEKSQIKVLIYAK